MEEKMKCALCENPIYNYNPGFNHLKIGESHAADICQECIDKFIKWQQNKFARMFPTSAVKKRFGAGK